RALRSCQGLPARQAAGDPGHRLCRRFPGCPADLPERGSVPGDAVPESGDVGGQPRQSQPVLDELKSSAQWLEHAALVGGALVRLAGMELRLAAGDSGRMLLLALTMIPVAILAWTGLAVLLAWLVFTGLGSVAWGVAGLSVSEVLSLGSVGGY